MAKELDVPFLGRIPLDPRVGYACDEGKNFFELYPDSQPAAAYAHLSQGNNLIQQT